MANPPSGKPLGGMARAFAALRGKLYAPPSQTISSINPQAWPSALQPVQPTAPKGSQPLAFSFWQGINLEITPRADIPLTFYDLRELATYPLARICIENVKDILTSMPWKVALKRIPGEPVKDWKDRQKDTGNISKIKMLTEFFEYPDAETPWSDWWRPVIEDMLTIDAPSILIERTLGDKVVKLRWTDGANILRLITDQGFTPDQKSPAYTQLWEGIPRLLLTTRQMVYRPSNIVARNSYASKMYGMSITEQMAAEIQIGMARLAYVLAYYKDGAVPNLIRIVPAGILPDKISENMQWANSKMAGNLAQRRGWNEIQGYHTTADGKQDQIVEPKEPVLADVFDDLHIRKMAYAYGVSAQRLLKQMNRASAESGQDAAEKEGTMPRLQWMKNTADYILQRQMDMPDYELVFDTDDELDAVKQATVDDLRVKSGLDTIDEIRDDRGQVPFGFPETSQPIIITNMGVQPLQGSFDRVQQQLDNDTTQANNPTPKPVMPAAGGGASSGKASGRDVYRNRY